MYKSLLAVIVMLVSTAAFAGDRSETEKVENLAKDVVASTVGAYVIEQISERTTLDDHPVVIKGIEFQKTWGIKVSKSKMSFKRTFQLPMNWDFALFGRRK